MQILIIQKGIEAFEYRFEPFERDSNHSNANTNTRKGFEAFESEFEPLEKVSKHSNANLNHLKGIRNIGMQILTVQKRFEAFECKF